MTDMRIHEGRNVKRFREMLGIKQEALAAELGTDWNQKKISLLEQRERIDAPILDQVSKALKIPVEAIQSFDEERAVNIIANTFQGEAAAFVENFKCNFNPIEKIVELYERLLASEREKVEILKNQTNKI